MCLAQMKGQVGKERRDLLRLEARDNLLSALGAKAAEQGYSPGVVQCLLLDSADRQGCAR
jgi:hypothetical protein